MKKYIAPKLQMVDLRSEESFAMASVAMICNGACTKDIDYPRGGVVEYQALNS